MEELKRCLLKRKKRSVHKAKRILVEINCSFAVGDFERGINISKVLTETESEREA